MLHGYTYSYMHRTPRKGQKGPCCRPTKQKCAQDDTSIGGIARRNVCKTSSGRTKCGAGCKRLIAAIEGLMKKQERKKRRKEQLRKEKEQKKKAKLKSSSTAPPKKEKEEDSESFEEYSDEEYSDEEESESFEEYSEEEEKQDTAKKEAKKEAKKGDKGEMVMRVKKDQKLSSKQLKMIESATEVRATSTNPLCKEKASMFRFVWH